MTNEPLPPSRPLSEPAAVEPPLSAFQSPEGADTTRLRSAAGPDDLAARTPEERRKTYATGLAFAGFLVVFTLLKPDWVAAIASFIVVLGVLVFVHEWGHYQFARWAGMKVNRFAIGFPPFVYTRVHKGISYSVGALPIGGMVDIAGLGSEEEMVAQVKGEEAANPTRSTRRPLAPFGQRQFQDANLFWRFMTLFAGPMMNFLFAIVAFIAVFSLAGIPIQHYKPVILSVTTNQPAAQGGMKASDLITRVNGQAVTDATEVGTLIQRSGTRPITIEVNRKGTTIPLAITPVLRDIYNEGKPRPSIGIQFDQQPQDLIRLTYQRLNPSDAIKAGFLESAGVAFSILDVLKRAVVRNLSPEEVKGIGGPVAIARVTRQAASFGPIATLYFAATLSVNLGLMNLLPIPALDGGRILFVFIGSAYEKIAHRPIDPRKETLVHLAGMALLLAFMLFITARDILPLIKNHL